MLVVDGVVIEALLIEACIVIPFPVGIIVLLIPAPFTIISILIKL